MKGPAPLLRCSLVVAAAISLLLAMNGCSKEEPKPDGQATIENLKLAYASEMKRLAWYDTFAKQAQKENLGAVAVLFRVLSQSEKIHADNMVKYLKSKGVEPVAPAAEAPPAGKTKQYLKLAASSESVEVESMYSAFALKADAEQDSATAQMFRETLEADARHGRLLKKAIDGDMNFSLLFMCPKCGFIVGSEKDEECRGCKAKKETFKKIS